MGFWSWLFGDAKGKKPESYSESDDRGTRHDTYSKASAYWLTRMTMQRKDPYVLYSFDKEEDARAALMQVPCIHVAEDTGNLICSEVLVYGYYSAEGKYEAIICGDDLSHETWAIAKESFIKHGGKPRNEGELEPTKTSGDKHKGATPRPAKVKFLREDRETKMGATLIYRIHSAPDAASAKAFLEQNPVSKQLYYIVVETPDGNYCRDIQGIYKE